MTPSSVCPPSSLKRVTLPVAMARLSHSMDDYSRLRSIFLRAGGLFFHAFQHIARPFGKRLGGPVGSFAIHAASLDRSSLNAIKHEAKSQCVPNPEHFINNRRVK